MKQTLLLTLALAVVFFLDILTSSAFAQGVEKDIRWEERVIMPAPYNRPPMVDTLWQVILLPLVGGSNAWSYKA